MMIKHLQVPVYVRALGDEMRALDRYVGLGLITQEEAQERLAEWEIFYPPGFHRIDELGRRWVGHQPLPPQERNVRPWDIPEAAE